MVKRPIEELETPIKTITGLKGPWGVVVNKKGEIIIAEEGAHCISIYSHAGEKLRSLGSKGSGQGEFIGPRGVAVDNDGNILVVDTKNNRIQKFTADGKFITAVGSVGIKELEFDYPTGIAINPINKRIYVSESINKRVQILNPDLTLHSKFKTTRLLSCPHGVAFDKGAHNVYITEEYATRIQVFTEKGVYLQQLGDKKLTSAHDVSIDSNNTIYVCNTGNHQICILDSNGKLLKSFGTKGGQPGQFSHPCGLTVDKNGLIYVCLLYTSPSPRDATLSRMPSSA